MLKSLLSPTRPADNVVITTKGLKDRNINILDGTTVENKGKLILTFFKMIIEFVLSKEIINIFLG